MPELARSPSSYRDDGAVPPFDDSRTLFVFDGFCVLCSGGAGWLMRVDRRRLINFTPVKSPLGRALCQHYGIDPDETYLLLDNGRAYTATRRYVRLCAVLGGAWHALRLGAIVPERWRDRVYAAVARNRYRWFGKTDACALLTPEQRDRLL